MPIIQTVLDTVRDACMELIEEQGELTTRELDLILKCNKKIRFALRKVMKETQETGAKSKSKRK